MVGGSWVAFEWQSRLFPSHHAAALNTSKLRRSFAKAPRPPQIVLAVIISTFLLTVQCNHLCHPQVFSRATWPLCLQWSNHDFLHRFSGCECFPNWPVGVGKILYCAYHDIFRFIRCVADPVESHAG